MKLFTISKELAEEFPDTKEESEKSRYNNLRNLLDESILDIITKKITDVVYGLMSRVAESTTDSYIKLALDLKIATNSGWRNQLTQLATVLMGTETGAKEYLTKYLRRDDDIIRLKIVPNFDHSTSFDGILKECRITKKQYMLPIGNYDLYDKGLDPEYNSYSPDKLELGTTASIRRYRFADPKNGKVISRNSLHASLYGNVALRQGIDNGEVAVYRDQYQATSIRVEGVIRVCVKHIRSTKVPKSNAYKKRKGIIKSKISYYDLVLMKREFLRKIKSVLEKNTEVASLNISLEYKKKQRFFFNAQYSKADLEDTLEGILTLCEKPGFKHVKRLVAKELTKELKDKKNQYEDDYSKLGKFIKYIQIKGVKDERK